LLRRIRLGTLILLVATVALGLAVTNLQGRLVRREAELATLHLRLKREGQYLPWILLDSRATTAGRSIEKSSSIVAEVESADEVEESIDEKEESSPEVAKPRPPSRRAARAPQAKGDRARGIGSVRVKKPKFISVVGSIVWVRDQDGSTIEVDHWVRRVMPETEEALR